MNRFGVMQRKKGTKWVKPTSGRVDASKKKRWGDMQKSRKKKETKEEKIDE